MLKSPDLSNASVMLVAPTFSVPSKVPSTVVLPWASTESPVASSSSDDVWPPILRIHW